MGSMAQAAYRGKPWAKLTEPHHPHYRDYQPDWATMKGLHPRDHPQWHPYRHYQTHQYFLPYQPRRLYRAKLKGLHRLRYPRLHPYQHYQQYQYFPQCRWHLHRPGYPQPPRSRLYRSYPLRL